MVYNKSEIFEAYYRIFIKPENTFISIKSGSDIDVNVF